MRIPISCKEVFYMKRVLSYLGRTTYLDDARLNRLLALYYDSPSLEKLATLLGVDAPTVRRVLSE